MTQATPLLGINFSFLVSTDMINNCTKFEACSFSHCEDMARQLENVQFGETVKNCCQATSPPLKVFLYSCCFLVRKLSARAMLTLCFDVRSHFAAVSEFVEAGSVENRFLDIFTQRRHPTDFRDESLMFCNPGRGAIA